MQLVWEDHLVQLEHQVPQDRLEQPVQRVPPVPQGRLEQPVHPGYLVPVVRPVLLERQDKLDQVELQVPLELPDLQV